MGERRHAVDAPPARFTSAPFDAGRFKSHRSGRPVKDQPDDPLVGFTAAVGLHASVSAHNQHHQPPTSPEPSIKAGFSAPTFG